MISVVLITWNGERYIEEQFRSVIAQTYKDIEIIVIDNASSDHTLDILHNILLETPDPRVKIITDSRNSGINAAFEKGVRMAQGSYIAFCDQDDVWKKEKLELLYKHLEESGKKMVFAPSLILKKEEYTNVVYLSTRVPCNRFKKLMINKARGASMLIEKSFLEQLLPFSNDGLYDKWIYFLSHCLGEVSIYSKPLDYYRIHDTNVIGQRLNKKDKASLMTQCHQQESFYNELAERIINLNKPVSQGHIRTVENIIRFHQILVATLQKRNPFVAFYAYVRYVLLNFFDFRNNFIYFYYLFLKKR